MRLILGDSNALDSAYAAIHCHPCGDYCISDAFHDTQVSVHDAAADTSFIRLPVIKPSTFAAIVLLLRSVWSPASAETPFSMSFAVRLESSMRLLLSESSETALPALLTVPPAISTEEFWPDSEVSGQTPDQHLQHADSRFLLLNKTYLDFLRLLSNLPPLHSLHWGISSPGMNRVSRVR